VVTEAAEMSVNSSGPWHRIEVARGPDGPTTQQRLLDAMDYRLRERALQASGWRASGRSVREIRVQIYAGLESDVVVWYLNDAALGLYRSAGGRQVPRERLDAVPVGRASVLLLNVVDHWLTSIVLLGGMLPPWW
jgi:hypothetical protein